MLIGFGLTAVSSWSLYPRIQMQLLGQDMSRPLLLPSQRRCIAAPHAHRDRTQHGCAGKNSKGRDAM
jgi:hypothetical protein